MIWIVKPFKMIFRSVNIAVSDTFACLNPYPNRSMGNQGNNEGLFDLGLRDGSFNYPKDKKRLDQRNPQRSIGPLFSNNEESENSSDWLWLR